MTKHINTTDAQRAELDTLPTTAARELHIGVEHGIVTISVDVDRNVPIITTTVRTPDARHILCTCYTAVTGSSPAVRTDSQQTARLWVGNFRVRIPADIVGLITHWLAANVPAANPAPRPIPACAAEAAKAIGVAA